MSAPPLAERLAKYAVGLTFEKLTSEAVHEAKRRFIDSIQAPFAERRGRLDRRRCRGGGWLAISAHPCSSGS